MTCRHHHPPIGQLQHMAYEISGEAGRVSRLVYHPVEFYPFLIINIQTGILRACPYPAFFVFEQLQDRIAAKAMDIVWFIGENIEVVAIVPVQSIFGRHPYKALLVLQDVENHSL